MKFFKETLAGKAIAAIFGLTAVCLFVGLLTALLVAAFKFGYALLM